MVDATNSTLTLTAFSAQGVGDYDVIVANSAGSLTSLVARVSLEAVEVPLVIEVSSAATGPGYVLSFKAQAGRAYQVEATEDLSSGTWVKIQDIAAGVEVTTQVITDQEATKHAQRFYRVVAP